MPPFTAEVKREVKERAGGYVCEITGRRDRPIEFMHKFHGRGELFNLKENCIEVIDMMHLAYHIRFWESPQLIGLNHNDNMGAIRLLTSRVTQFSYARNLLGQYDEDLMNCMNCWDIYFESHRLPERKDLKRILESKVLMSV